MSIQSVIDGLIPHATLPNGVTVQYSDGRIDCDWFGEPCSVRVDEVSLDSVMRLGLERTLLDYLYLVAPKTTLEFAQHGRITASPYGLATWIMRGDRLLAWNSDYRGITPPAPGVNDFSVRISGGVVAISSARADRLAHESGAWGRDFLQSVLGDTYLISESSRVALSLSPNETLTIGHARLVERMCNTSQGSLCCLSPDDLQSIR